MSSIEDKKYRWDQYFYNIATEVSKNSKCLSRQIGAILVKDKSIISSGYNGPPSGVPHCNERYLVDIRLREMLKSKGIDPDNEHFHDTCPRRVLGYKSGEGLHLCIAGHAERNCLANAGALSISSKGTIMYMTCSMPCTPCLISILAHKVKEIVITEKTLYDEASQFILENSNLKVRLFKHLCNHKNKVGGYCADCDSDIGW